LGLIIVGPLKDMILFLAVTAPGDSVFWRTTDIKAMTTAAVVYSSLR
jgi:hypothetical protein